MGIVKKTLKIVLIALSIVSVAHAQTTSIGPLVGVNFSSFAKQPDIKYLPGLSIGGFLNHSINENFGITGKLLYSQMGSAYKNLNNINRLHYLQLPITAVYYFGEQGQRFRPKIYAGLYTGVLLKGFHKDDEQKINENTLDDYKKTDFGGVVGLGFNYRVGDRMWLNTEAGYSAGFVDITKEAGLNFNNKGFNLNVGLSFPIK